MPSAATPVTVQRHPESNVKETVESILVAFILAFVFRAFVVEAFVIPTGSMAPTLLGAHRQFTCADCGYEFTVNHPPRYDTAPVYCPNCGNSVAKVALTPEYGDRILVLKYRYLLSEPKRWDVVVFKAPEPVENAPRYTTNYIKRLIGKPGESVMVLDGDVYISTVAPPVSGDTAARVDFLKTFKVQTKPWLAQEALWRVVYDNDYQPRATPTSSNLWKQPWTAVDPAGGWSLGDSATGRTRSVSFKATGGDGGRLQFDPDANPHTNAFTDALAYDQQANESRSERNTVSDLKLSCFYARTAGEGPFEMLLSKRDDVFVARVLPGKVKLVWERGNGQVVKEYDATVGALSGTTPVRLDLTNVDYRVSLRVNGTEVVSTGEDYFPDGEQILDIQSEEARRGKSHYATLPRAELFARDQTCTLEHLSLWRDTFYVNEENPGAITGVMQSSPRHIMSLGPDEFFVMGDNPWISSDARVWSLPVDLPGEDLHVDAGRVPRRFLLGKAFFVYWPAGFQPAPFVPMNLVPNFGEMRFIH